MHIPHYFVHSNPADAPDKHELHPEQAGAAQALTVAVDQSGKPGAATSGAGVLGKADGIFKTYASSWLKDYIPGIEKYAAQEELGNYVVIDRKTGQKAWESMPIYVRVGMSLLFTGHGDSLLGVKYINSLLTQQSVKQGKLFDQEEGALEHILAFIQTYNLESSLPTLLQPDPKAYKTFNQFFYRALHPSARPADSAGDPRVVVSAADCRLTVWESVPTAQQFWIKGRQFTIPHLLHDDAITSHPGYANGCSLAIFRLAPQDYHRWHSPLDGVIGPTKPIAGSLYTVNPMAVRNPDVDVFTANKRDIRILSVPSLKEGEAPIPIFIVSIGAMLVGSIVHTKKEGEAVTKGEELGYFAYGGSTVVAIFPSDFIKFDEDLVNYSKQTMETVVKVGEHIGVRA